MAAILVLILAVVGGSQAQTDRCTAVGGRCSYNACSRYYVSSSSSNVCPSAFQRCCYPERCLVTYGGNCQHSSSTCSGSKYTHDRTTRLCSRSVDVCCITNMPGKATTTPPPATPPVKLTPNKCGNYGGKCINQRTQQCPGGQLRLLGSKSEILCNNWLANNERCCMASSQTTPAPKTTPTKKENCANYGGVCASQVKYRCNNGEFQLYGKNREILCSAWATNNERCCMRSSQSAQTTPAPVVTRPKPSSNTGADTCGIQKVSLKSKRIVGGNAAEKGEWPWQASIIKSTSVYGRSFMHTCGGTLVSPQWVVTAAHCFRGVTSSYSLRVRVGEHSFYVKEGTESDVVVSKVIIHKGYVASQNKNDIAMIKLSKPVDISGAYTRTACLPTTADLQEFYKTSECYTTGWGKTQGTGGDKNVLQEVQSKLVSQASCYYKWGYKIDSTKVCFGNGYRGACQGDSGGPLVCKKDGRFHLVGVVSYGSKSCTTRNVPTVFTSVAAFRSWIDTTMASN